MLKYKYIKQTTCFLMLLVIFSCKKDLGNYDYEDINAVDIGGIEKSYNTLLGGKFKITPELKFTKDDGKDENRYTYEWVAMNLGGVLPAEVRKFLSDTRNLDITVTVPPGSYRVYYKVTDKQTGVTYQRNFALKVETSIFEGWMVLNDVNGAARLDMVSKINDVFSTITDVLATTGSELVLAGKPLDVTCYRYDPNIFGIYISTDKGTNRIDPETFKWKNTYNLAYEVVANTPADFHADFLAPLKEDQGVSYMYSGGDVYYYYRIFQINYSSPVNLVKGETVPFKAAPFLTTARDMSNFNASTVMFDIEKKRFLKHGNNEASSSKFAAKELFDPNNVGMDLAYMAYSTYGAGEVFAVLKNPAGKMYLARFNAFSGAQSYFEEIVATGIANAEKFAVSPVFGYLFYSVGGKVYEYDTSLRISKQMLDKGAEKITLLKFENFGSTFNKPIYEEKRTHLIVGSYDPALPADKNGKLELFKVPSLNGDLIPSEKYTGFGKIVSVNYRIR